MRTQWTLWASPAKLKLLTLFCLPNLFPVWRRPGDVNIIAIEKDNPGNISVIPFGILFLRALETK